MIVVDNNSQDGTDEVVSRFIKDKKSVDVQYVNTGKNLGGAGGFEYGVKIVDALHYDYLWLMDDDLMPAPNCLELLLSTQNCDIVQPLRVNKDGSCAELSPIFYDLSSPFLINPKRKTVKQMLDEFPMNNAAPFSMDGISFEGPVISRRVVSVIGFPDPRFFIFNDVLDYALRAKRAGFSVQCQPLASAIRLLENNQKNDLLSWKGYFMLRNHFYILYKYGESYFVRIRPYFLGVAVIAYSIFMRKRNLFRFALSAMMDFKNLQNNDKYRP